MNATTIIETLKLAAIGLALLSDTSKVKRAVGQVKAEWQSGKPSWRRALIDVAIVTISLGGPLHCGFQLTHELASWA